MLVDVASASMSNGKVDITVLAYNFCSIITQLVQLNKFKFFLEIIMQG
jgi:hypothetical protein